MIYAIQYKNNLKGFVTWGNNDNLTWHHCIDKNGNYLNAHIIDSNGNYKNEYLHLINIFNQHNKNHWIFIKKGFYICYNDI